MHMQVPYYNLHNKPNILLYRKPYKYKYTLIIGDYATYIYH